MSEADITPEDAILNHLEGQGWQHRAEFEQEVAAMPKVLPHTWPELCAEPSPIVDRLIGDGKIEADGAQIRKTLVKPKEDPQRSLF